MKPTFKQPYLQILTNIRSKFTNQTANLIMATLPAYLPRFMTPTKVLRIQPVRAAATTTRMRPFPVARKKPKITQVSFPTNSKAEAHRSMISRLSIGQALITNWMNS
jgi:hypothetical protein